MKLHTNTIVSPFSLLMIIMWHPIAHNNINNNATAAARTVLCCCCFGGGGVCVCVSKVKSGVQVSCCGIPRDTNKIEVGIPQDSIFVVMYSGVQALS